MEAKGSLPASHGPREAAQTLDDAGQACHDASVDGKDAESSIHQEEQQPSIILETQPYTPTASDAVVDPAPLDAPDLGPPCPPDPATGPLEDSSSPRPSKEQHTSSSMPASPAVTQACCSPANGGLPSSRERSDQTSRSDGHILEELHSIADEFSQRSTWEGKEAPNSDADQMIAIERQAELHTTSMATAAALEPTVSRPAVSASDDALNNLFQDSIAEMAQARGQEPGAVIGASMAPEGAESCAYIQQSFFPEAQNPFETMPNVLQPAQRPASQQHEICPPATSPHEKRLSPPMSPSLKSDGWKAPCKEVEQAGVSARGPSQEAFESHGQKQDDGSNGCEATASSRQPETQSLFAEFESIDFDAVNLTPTTHQAGVNLDRPQTQESPLATRARTRTFTRHATKDSFDDLACDSGFWEEAFDCQDALPEEYDADPGHGKANPSSDDPDLATPLQSPPPGAFLGFQTAANRKIAPPSEEAMAKARRRFEELNGPEIAGGSGRDALGSKSARPEQARPIVSARPQGLTDGRDLQADEDDAFTDEDAPVPPSSDPTEPIPQFVSFQKASGGSLNLSKAALEAAKRRMAQWDAEVLPDEIRSPATRPSALVTSAALPPMSRVQPSPPSTFESRDRAGIASTDQRDDKARDEVTATPRPPLVGAREALASHRPQTPVAAYPGPVAPTSATTAFASYATPVRPAADRPALGTSRSVGPGIDGTPRPNLIGRTSRISLGMTPRAKVAASGKAFKTPFKSGARPAPSAASVTPRSPDIFRSANHMVKSPTKGEVGSELLLPSKANPALFDVRAHAPRLTLRQFGMQPRRPTRSSIGDELSEIPIILQNPKQAARFIFDSPAGNPLGPAEVLEELKHCGASHVDIDWVKNHWVLILWKLAAYANCRPEQSEIWWSFEQVCRQMKYR